MPDQFFAGPIANMTSELLAELDVGKPIAFRLDPRVRQASSCFVSLKNGQLAIQPE